MRPDIATANCGSDDVSVLVQTGEGDFLPFAGSPIPTGGETPAAIAAGRLDADHRVDLVVANSGSSGATGISVTVLLNGEEGFTQAPGSPIPPASAVGSSALVLADFDEDGRLDFATNGVSVRMGNGDGTFGTALRVADTARRPVSRRGISTRTATSTSCPDGPGSPGSRCCTATGAGGFSERSALTHAGGFNFLPNALAIGRFNPDAHSDLLATTPFVNPQHLETAAAARVYPGGDDGDLVEVGGGPWTSSPGRPRSWRGTSPGTADPISLAAGASRHGFEPRVGADQRDPLAGGAARTRRTWGSATAS